MLLTICCHVGSGVIKTTYSRICDRSYSHLVDVNDQYNVNWWPDVKPMCFGSDVIDHFVQQGGSPCRCKGYS